MYRVEITNSGPTAFTVKANTYEFIVDQKGSGVTPSDTLLASLGACIGVYIRKYCDGAKIALSDFAIVVEAAFEREPSAHFSQINVAIDFKQNRIDERRMQSLMAFIKNCPIHATLHSNPNITITVL